jgi:hypothetical protein
MRVAGGHAVQQQAVMTVADRRLTPGLNASLIGEQFPPGARVSLMLVGPGGRVSLGAVTAGPDSGFSHTVELPVRTRSGAYRLEARVTGGRILSSLDIAVLEPTPARTDATPSVATDLPDGAAIPPPDAPAVTGYDWPRLHAALNDLPAALLVVAVAFEIIGLIS